MVGQLCQYRDRERDKELENEFQGFFFTHGVFFVLLGRYLREVIKAHLEFVLCCWYATLEK